MTVPGQNFSSVINGQITTYTVDGIQVTQGHFTRLVEQAYGSIFGLVEQQARISARPPRLIGLSVGNEHFPATISGANRAINAAIETEKLIIIRTFAVNNSWVLNLSLLTQALQQSQQTQSNKDGLNTGPKAVFSREKLRECLGKIGVTFKDEDIDFDRNSEGNFSGTFNPTNPILKAIIPAIELRTKVDVLSKDSSELARRYNFGLQPGEKRFVTQSGLTIANLPNTVYIANDLASNKKFTDIGLSALFIHELGNSIAVQIFGKDGLKKFGVNGLNGGDTDFGTTLEVCVFGRIVGVRSGRLGANREF